MKGGEGEEGVDEGGEVVGEVWEVEEAGDGLGGGSEDGIEGEGHGGR